MIYDEVEHLSGLKAFLKGKILGQDVAIEKFASSMERAYSFPPRVDRPRLMVLLLGPTGTGKTEIVLLSVNFIYGDKQHLERLDLGEYGHEDSVQRLLGGPRQKSTLGAALDRLDVLGGGVLLLDELEKAHASIWPVLLGFDAGRVTLFGEATRSLERVAIVMTSNLGSAEAAKMDHAPDAAVERHVLRTAERALRPEVFARFSDRIVLRRLDAAAQRSIASLRFGEELRLRSREIGRRLLPGRDAGVFLAGEGFSPELGARPLRRAVEMHVADALLARRPTGSAEPVGAPITCLDDAWILDRSERGLVAHAVAEVRTAPRSQGTLTHEHTNE